MVVLKRVKGSTLLETMIATVLVIVIFMIASVVMESTMTTKLKGNMDAILEKCNELEYQYQTGIISLPYYEEWQDWEIEITDKTKNGLDLTELLARNKVSKKEVKTFVTFRHEYE